MSAGSAPFGFKRHRTGARASFHAAPQIIEDRSPDSGHGAPSLGSDGHQLCPPTLVRNRLPTTTLLTSEPDQLGPAVHKTGKQTSSQRELCQKFVSAPPRKALAVVSSRAPLPSSPIAPADYHFRYLLLIGEKERLIEEAEGHLADASKSGNLGRFQLEAAIQSVHAERASGRRVEWRAIVQFYRQLIRISPTIGRQTGYAAALAEANGVEEGLAVLDAIDQDAVSAYQPYWAVRAHLLQLRGKGLEAQHVYDRASGLSEDPAVREFLLK